MDPGLCFSFSVPLFFVCGHLCRINILLHDLLRSCYHVIYLSIYSRIKKLKSYKQAVHAVQGSFKEVNMAESLEIVFQHFVGLTFRKTARQRMEERGNSVT